MEQLVGDLEAQAATLARLGMVYADELRMKIVTEAYIREISPKAFQGEFGGGSVPRVAKHFDRLAHAEWLSLARTESGGARRGAVEHFYRANELVIFEEETWATLPTSVRAAFTWTTFEQLTERVTAAILTGTFDARPDRHLSCTPIVLDRLGWKRVLAAADVVFRSVLEEQDRASERFAASGGQADLTTVALAVFESPVWTAGRSLLLNGPYTSAGLFGPGGIERGSFFPTFAKLCANPVDLRIVDELNRRELSPKLLHALMGDLTLPGSDRRLRKIARHGWSAEVRQATGGRRRGATEHFYRAVGPALAENKSWAGLPEELKAPIAVGTFERLRERVKEAVEAGTLDARVDRHLTWSLLRLDRIGWEKAVGVVEGFFAALGDEEREATQRIRVSGEKPILTTVGLAAFESSRDSVKEL